MSKHDKRVEIPSNGIPTYLLKYATLKSNQGSGASTKLTVGAYRNGIGSVYMLMSIEYHTNHWYIIPINLSDLQLFKTN